MKIKNQAEPRTWFVGKMLAGTALALVSLTGAQAQAQDTAGAAYSDQDENEDSILIVTGSRIRGVAPVGSDLISIGEDEIAKSGATSVSEILKLVPQVTSLSINSEGASGSGASSNLTRASGPNLRGLGQSATLVVLDGERVAAQGTQGNFVDPSFLPSIAIRRLEVIADGASAIYGSDAVAGVVNLVPRKSVDGFEFRARGGWADAYSEYQVSGIGGTSWDSGNIVVAAEWTKNDMLLASDRVYVGSDRSHGGGADARATACSPATISLGGQTYAVPAGQTGVLDFSTLAAGTLNRCDVEEGSFLIPSQERLSLYGYLSQDITDTVRFFAQGVYSTREYSGPMNGQATATSYVVPTTNAYYPLNAPAGTLTANMSFLDVVGPIYDRGKSRAYHLLAGLEVDLGSWVVTAKGTYGESYDESERDPTIYAPSLNAALASSNPATAINPFNPGANSHALVSSFYQQLFNPMVWNKLKTVSVEGNGPLFDLPGGSVRMAVGGEYREESQYGLTINGTVAAPLPVEQSLGRNSKAVYAELYVPLFGAGNAVPGLEKLDLVAAVRHENYNDFGSTTNPKFGITWSPVSGISFRGSYGTSFRAPGLADMNPNSSGAGIRLRNYSVAGSTLPVTMAVLAAGNPGVQPETAETWSLGMDITPAALPGFNFSTTYFNVKYEGQIVDVYTMVAQVLAEPGNFQDITFLNDGSAKYLDAVAWLSGTQYYTPGSINFSTIGGIVDARKHNLGLTLSSGFDFAASYEFDLSGGDLTLSGVATLFLDYENSTGTGVIVDRLNTYGYPQRFRARGMIGWEKEGFSIQTAVNYVNAYDNMTSTRVLRVDGYTSVDLDLAYTFDEGAGGVLGGTRFGLNIRNLFDQDPPFVDAGLGYDPSSASAVGRMVSLSLSKSF